GGGWDVLNGNVDLLKSGGSLGAMFPGGINVIDNKGMTNSAIANTFATAVGTTYTVTFLMATNPDLPGDGSSQLVFTVNGNSTLFSHSLAPGSTWSNIGTQFVEHSVTFTATANSTTLQIASVLGGG